MKNFLITPILIIMIFACEKKAEQEMKHNTAIEISSVVEGSDIKFGQGDLSLQWTFKNKTDSIVFILLDTPYSFTIDAEAKMELNHSAQPDMHLNTRVNQIFTIKLVPIQPHQILSYEFIYQISLNPQIKQIELKGVFATGKTAPENFNKNLPDWKALESWQTIVNSNYVTIDLESAGTAPD